MKNVIILTQDDFLVCADEQNAALSAKLPAGSDTPLPPNPALEHAAAAGERPADLSNAAIGPPALPVKKGGGSVLKRPGVGPDPQLGTDYYDTNSNGGGPDSGAEQQQLYPGYCPSQLSDFHHLVGRFVVLWVCW